MAMPIPLRGDFDGSIFRHLARTTKDAAPALRLLAFAELCAGGSRSDAARIDQGKPAAPMRRASMRHLQRPVPNFFLSGAPRPNEIHRTDKRSMWMQ